MTYLALAHNGQGLTGFYEGHFPFDPTPYHTPCAHHPHCDAPATTPVLASALVGTSPEQAHRVWGTNVAVHLHGTGPYWKRIHRMGRCCGIQTAGSQCIGCGGSVQTADGAFALDSSGWADLSRPDRRLPYRLLCQPCAEISVVPTCQTLAPPFLR